MELHLHGMERSYGFESRQYPLKLNRTYYLVTRLYKLCYEALYGYK